MFRKCLSCFPIGFLPFTQEFATFCNQILFNDPACKPSPKPARKGAGLGGTYGAMGEHHKKKWAKNRPLVCWISPTIPNQYLTIQQKPTVNLEILEDDSVNPELDFSGLDLWFLWDRTWRNPQSRHLVVKSSSSDS